MAARHVVHVDMDAFYASVEQRDDPRLRGRPVLVGGDRRRGVVTSASYEARPYGIRSAMPMAEALARCPAAVVVPGRMDRYVAIAEELRGIFHRFTPLVEPLSLDEAFLDVTASVRLFGPPPAIAAAVKAAIRADTALPSSAGVAPNKFVAKIASEVAKPDGLLVVPADDVAAFLAPLPVRHVWGVGRVTERSLAALGLRTIGDLARADPRLLARRGGAELVSLARGIDERPVRPGRRPRSIGEERTFERDLRPGELPPRLLATAEDVARRLRARGLRARTIALKVKLGGRARDGRFPVRTRRLTLAEPTADEAVLFDVARRLLDALELEGRPVRLAGIAAAGLDVARPEQVALFPDARDTDTRRAAAARAVDALARRFGSRIVRRALPPE